MSKKFSIKVATVVENEIDPQELLDLSGLTREVKPLYQIGDIVEITDDLHGCLNPGVIVEVSLRDAGWSYAVRYWKAMQIGWQHGVFLEKQIKSRVEAGDAKKFRKKSR